MITQTITNQELLCRIRPEHLVVDDQFMVGSTQLLKGTVVGIITTAAANDVQTLTGGTGTAGTFGLLVGSSYGLMRQVLNVPYNVTAAALQALLQALDIIGAGNLVCAGGPLGTSAITITGANSLAGQPLPLIQVINNAVTGGTGPGIAHTTPGVANGAIAAYGAGHADGTQTATGILLADSTTDLAGLVTEGLQSTGDSQGAKSQKARVAIAGYFNTADIVGIDSTAVGQLGRIVRGTIADGVLAVYGA